jgi:putative ATP-dependent endonuclease of OLD family
VKSVLKRNKGAGMAARLFDGCTAAELPATVTSFLKRVYSHFPKPTELSAEEPQATASDNV